MSKEKDNWILLGVVFLMCVIGLIHACRSIMAERSAEAWREFAITNSLPQK